MQACDKCKPSMSVLLFFSSRNKIYCFSLALFGHAKILMLEHVNVSYAVGTESDSLLVPIRALAESFERFGEVARAVVAVDEKGQPQGK